MDFTTNVDSAAGLPVLTQETLMAAVKRLAAYNPAPVPRIYVSRSIKILFAALCTLQLMRPKRGVGKRGLRRWRGRLKGGLWKELLDGAEADEMAEEGRREWTQKQNTTQKP